MLLMNSRNLPHLYLPTLPTDRDTSQLGDLFSLKVSITGSMGIHFSSTCDQFESLGTVICAICLTFITLEIVGSLCTNSVMPVSTLFAPQNFPPRTIRHNLRSPSEEIQGIPPPNLRKKINRYNIVRSFWEFEFSIETQECFKFI